MKVKVKKVRCVDLETWLKEVDAALEIAETTGRLFRAIVKGASFYDNKSYSYVQIYGLGSDVKSAIDNLCDRITTTAVFRDDKQVEPRIVTPPEVIEEEPV